MATELPLTPSVPHYRVAVALAGIDYLLDFRWNARDAAWYMDVFGSDGKIVAAGLKLVIGQMIGARHVGVPKFPRGVFIVGDTSGERRDATLDDLGTRVIVRFYSYTDMVFFQMQIAGAL